MSLLVAAGLGLAGFIPHCAPLSTLRRDAQAGKLAGIIALDDPDDSEPVALAAPGEPVAPPTLHWDAQAGADLATLIAEVRALWPPRAPPSTHWDSDATAVPAARILAALGRLRPDLKLTLETPKGRLGLCAVHGRIVSAGLDGSAILEAPSVLGDPSLALVLELWGAGRASAEAGPRLDAELEFVCEYAELFARAPGFVAHVEQVLAETLALPVSAVSVEPHEPIEHGTDVLELLRRALGRAPADVRASFLPTGWLFAPRSIPRWLRAALPAQRYGRLFFALEEGATLGDAIGRGRIDGPDAEVAVALAALTGAVVARSEPAAPRTGHRVRPATVPLPAFEVPPAPAPAPARDRAAQAPLAPPTRDRTTPLSSVKIAPETEARLAARAGRAARAPPPTGPARRPTHPIGLEAPRAEGSKAAPPTEEAALAPEVDAPRSAPLTRAPQGFLLMLRQAAEEARRTGRHPRLAGTRFEPIGEPLEDILLYFRIGSGGTGDVFLGVQGGHGGFQKTVAVKRLVAEHSAEERFRVGFLDEARVAASLEHPNIVPIFRLLEDAGRHHLVMEYVHGVSVAQLAAAARVAHAIVPESIVRFIGAEVARGLHYMHNRRGDEGERLGLVHRDVAPPNILLGFDGTVKLIDLSIAQSRDDARSLASKGALTGRLGYMAPEVLASVGAGPTSDLFGLAATLYELAVGESCFVRGSPHSTIEAIARADFRPVLKARPDLSPRLAYAIERGLALQPASRFKDLAAFREALLRDATEPDPAGRLEQILESRFGDLHVREREAIDRMRRSASTQFASSARPMGGRAGAAAEPNAEDGGTS